MPSSDEEDFVVEAVLGKKTVKGKPQFLLKWRGYPASEATWEPEENCTTCEELISKYEEANVASPPIIEPKAAARSTKRKAKASAASAKVAKDPKDPKGNHKYKDEDGRLDRKKHGYYDLKNTWASAGQAQQAHSGLTTNLSGKALPKAFKVVDDSAKTKAERIIGDRGKDDDAEYKIKWDGLNTAHATWMTVPNARKKLGDATFDTLLETYKKSREVEDEWVGEPLPAEVAAARWPKRERPGIVNYEAVIVNGVKVCVGDTVRTIADVDYYDDKGGAEDDLENTWVCVVEELWGYESQEFVPEDGDLEDKFFAARWFWRAKDTVCKDMADRQPDVAYAMDPRRIFIEKKRTSEDLTNSGHDDSPVTCIHDVVKVERCNKDEADADVDFFYDMSYDEEFCTFEDVNEYTPPPMEHPAIGAHADGSWSAVSDVETDGYLQLLILFCMQQGAAGGFTLVNCGRAIAEPTEAEVEAVLGDAAGSGKRASKKAQITARIAKVLTQYVKDALAHSPQSAFVKRTVVEHGWQVAQQKFAAPPTQTMLKEIGKTLDAPGLEKREALAACKEFGSPGYGEGVKGASVSAPTSLSRKLRCLDLYAGAGGLSFMDGKRGNASISSAWAVDIDRGAIETFGTNNPQTECFVHGTDEFLYLVKAWNTLCEELEDVDVAAQKRAAKKKKGGKQPEKLMDVRPKPIVPQSAPAAAKGKGKGAKRKKSEKKREDDEDEDEAQEFNELGWEQKLEFLVRWEGGSEGSDSWVEEADLPQHILAEFVQRWMKRGRIPRPGDVDVLTGGPPCQGISGYNMCRNGEDPLSDPKNRQMPLFFEIVAYLKPRYVLMENVPDMFKFTTGIYGRFSVSRLIELGYQGRVGFMVAGRYGVPQYRMRCFLWGALSGQPLPGYPMPSHRVITVNQNCPAELKTNEVKAPPGQKLRREIRLRDALTDLPNVAHDEARDEMPYGGKPETEFQKDMRAPPPKDRGIPHQPKKVFNHNPQPLPPDDLYRCEHVPLKKGACWRDLGTLSKDGKSTVKPFKWLPLADGKVKGAPDNNTHPDSSKLPPGDGRDPSKCIVPQYCINKAGATTLERCPDKPDHKGGDKSLARLWWDEIFTTCIGRMMIHSHRNMHPGEFRSFSAREYARAQGFPDWYKICGSASKYCNKKYDNPKALVPLNKFQQIGNAVSPRLARAMGECLLMSLIYGTPRHAVVKWQPDPEDGPNTVRDWRKGQSQREAAAGAAAEAGEDSGTDEEFQDDDDVAPAAAKPRRGAKKKTRKK